MVSVDVKHHKTSGGRGVLVTLSQRKATASITRRTRLTERAVRVSVSMRLALLVLTNLDWCSGVQLSTDTDARSGDFDFTDS